MQIPEDWTFIDLIVVFILGAMVLGLGIRLVQETYNTIKWSRKKTK